MEISGRKCDCTYDCACHWACRCSFLCSCCKWHAKVCPLRTSTSFFEPNSVTNCGVHCSNLHACFCILCADKNCILCKKKHPTVSLLHYITCKEYMMKWKRERERLWQWQRQRKNNLTWAFTRVQVARARALLTTFCHNANVKQRSQQNAQSYHSFPLPFLFHFSSISLPFPILFRFFSSVSFSSTI